ncbi:hypothetical protein PR202_gb07119 [Eleusine coracana subsp. coracana]|uniref:Benzyl alcohol O-benzoyltransferase n=1 Tax=Eleusine coracana subsp. coracana TaxID=191504 RepID=A0AAV5E9L2_ELECO|nr:hypothetical protein PR202_gb07119 [Eleusine coracana subsp. coracana]
MTGSAPTLKFTVRRRPAVLVPPAAATPRELKCLSDIDDQDGLRFHIPIIQFYRRSVTRLACGGFVLAVRQRHTMADAQGLVQFLGAVAELARGAATSPTVRPVWAREMLEARRPPRPAFAHREYDDQVPNTTPVITLPDDGMVHRSFFFGRREVAAVRARLPPFLRSRATAFDVIAGCLWKCRTAALAPDAADDAVMRMICVASARSGGGAVVIPAGYYGNAFAFPAALATAGELRGRPVGYAVELVGRAKRGVDVEYLRSVAELMVLRGRPQFAVAHAFLVSDVTKAGFGGLDFGWGDPAYGGPAKGSVGPVPGMASFLIASTKGADGERGVVVPMCLPGPAMDRFAEEMAEMMRPPANRQSAL